MSVLSWVLTAAWVAAILVVVFDMTDWVFETECLRTRQRRSMLIVLASVALTMFALWTVIFPYIQVPS